MNQEFYDAVEANPVIAAVKHDDGLQAAVEMEEIQVIFVLYGDICTIPEIVDRIKDSGKKALRIIASIILKVDKPRIKKPPTIT